MKNKNTTAVGRTGASSQASQDARRIRKAATVEAAAVDVESEDIVEIAEKCPPADKTATSKPTRMSKIGKLSDNFGLKTAKTVASPLYSNTNDISSDTSHAESASEDNEEVSDVYSDSEYSSSESEDEEDASRRAETMESKRSKMSEEEAEGADVILVANRMWSRFGEIRKSAEAEAEMKRRKTHRMLT